MERVLHGTGARPAWLRWRYAIPPEKGGWIWWLGPFAVGACAAGGWSPNLPAVLAGAFAAFCVRQPAVQLVKSARRGSAGAAPHAFWALVYLAVLAVCAAWLCRAGESRVLLLGGAAAPVLGWHLQLVRRGEDRHHLASDLLAAAALSLTGPAAYWAAGGGDPAVAFWVWLLAAAQSGASIVHMFLRLEWRMLHAAPPFADRLRRGLVPMACHLGAAGLAWACFSQGSAAWPVLPALLLPLIEGLLAVGRPQVRVPPKRLGMRQLAVSASSMLLLAAGLGR